VNRVRCPTYKNVRVEAPGATASLRNNTRTAAGALRGRVQPGPRPCSPLRHTMDEGGCLLKGEGGGGIYRVMRDCPTSQDVSPASPKSGKLRKKDEIVIIEWRLLASPPVMRVRCAEGWCTEREMDGALNMEHVHGRKVGQVDEPVDAGAGAGASSNSPVGRRKSVSVMTAGEKQALRRASVEIAQQQMATHLQFRDGDLSGGGGRAGALGKTMSARRLLDGDDHDAGAAKTCALVFRPPHFAHTRSSVDVGC
jgi:hypothetical protein